MTKRLRPVACSSSWTASMRSQGWLPSQGVHSTLHFPLHYTNYTNVSWISSPYSQFEPKVQQRGHPHSARADSGETWIRIFISTTMIFFLNSSWLTWNLNQDLCFHDDNCDYHQAILAGRLAPGAHVIVTSRPHTLTYLQVPNSKFLLFKLPSAWQSANNKVLGFGGQGV